MARKKNVGNSDKITSKTNRMSTLLSTLKKNKDLSKLMIDEGFAAPEYLNTNVMALNLVFSGKIDGGIKKGSITTIAADSQLGKSLIGYNILKCAYQEGMNCVIIDTEHAINLDILKTLEIDVNDIAVFQTSLIHEIKQIFSVVNQGLTKEESRNTFFLLDSWGPIVETQVIEKAEEGSSAVNMSSAKFKNELANIINHFGNTTFVINHVYASLNPYGDKFNVPGGKRLFFNSDAIAMASSAAKYKDRDGNILGKVITVGVKKGRGAKEFVKTQYLIRHDGGLDPYFGLLDEAINCGIVTKSKPGIYYRVNLDVDRTTGEIVREWKEKDLYTKEFWVPLYRDPKFIKHCEEEFSFTNTTLISSFTDLKTLINDDTTDEVEFTLPTSREELPEGEEVEEAEDTEELPEFEDNEDGLEEDS